ncbi:hypothetical protein XELAEV_18035999mg [Xenopus laevis]|uniref:Ig-like domain-containing protein n=1 Tax=Xenopus laevis TaxID=8355 RepID=A0A974CHY7_XENLA|nr:hypothetical protein XELAEV_18035999mg [Xenopus laevis]
MAMETGSGQIIILHMVDDNQDMPTPCQHCRSGDAKCKAGRYTCKIENPIRSNTRGSSRSSQRPAIPQIFAVGEILLATFLREDSIGDGVLPLFLIWTMAVTRYRVRIANLFAPSPCGCGCNPSADCRPPHVSNVALSSNASSGLLCPGKDSVNLTCSALGTNVTFSWYLDGAPLPPDSRYHLMNSNSSLIISPVMTTDTGFFTCTGSTSLNSETSIPLTLSFGCSPYGNVQCNAVKSDQSVTLSCSWPGGYPAANVTMLFQNKVETAQDTVTMNVPQNSISSGAELTCLGAQEGQITASTMILRTPIGTTSNFVSVVTKGDNVTMSVALEWSRNVSPRIQALPATFSWSQHDRPLSINGGKISVISSDYKSELVISSVTASDNGIYECVAENFIGKSTFPFELRVTAGSNQLSPGAIAGIVIAVLFVVALIPLTVIFILRKKNNNIHMKVYKGNMYFYFSNKQELQFPHNNVYNNLRKTPR